VFSRILLAYLCAYTPRSSKHVTVLVNLYKTYAIYRTFREYRVQRRPRTIFERFDGRTFPVRKNTACRAMATATFHFRRNGRSRSIRYLWGTRAGSSFRTKARIRRDAYAYKSIVRDGIRTVSMDEPISAVVNYVPADDPKGRPTDHRVHAATLLYTVLAPQVDADG